MAVISGAAPTGAGGSRVGQRKADAAGSGDGGRRCCRPTAGRFRAGRKRWMLVVMGRKLVLTPTTLVEAASPVAATKAGLS